MQFSAIPPFLFRLEINSTQYSPIRFLFNLGSMTNTQLKNSDGSAYTAASEFLATHQPRRPPTGSSISNSLVGFLGQISTGADAWFNFGWSYKYRYGDPTAVHSSDALYALPYYGTYMVNQGNGGSYSHNVGTAAQYSIDFGLPLQSEIRNARAGYVSMVQYDQSLSYSQACGTDLAGCGSTPGAQANYIFVVHPDNTMAIYIHLVENGVSVTEGQFVAVGDLLGLAGTTGNSTGPHLHFAVRTAAFENL